MYDKHTACRFSLAFQCIINIGVRVSEPIRSRVVQSSALDVVGCIPRSLARELYDLTIVPILTADGRPHETRGAPSEVPVAG